MDASVGRRAGGSTRRRWLRCRRFQWTDADAVRAGITRIHPVPPPFPSRDDIFNFNFLTCRSVERYFPKPNFQIKGSFWGKAFLKERESVGLGIRIALPVETQAVGPIGTHGVVHIDKFPSVDWPASEALNFGKQFGYGENFDRRGIVVPETMAERSAKPTNWC